jgi:hypothetical protein
MRRPATTLLAMPGVGAFALRPEAPSPSALPLAATWSILEGLGARKSAGEPVQRSNFLANDCQ